MLFTNLINRVWVSEQKDTYIFDRSHKSDWTIYYLREGEEQLIKCLDIWEVIGKLYSLTHEQSLFQCDLDEGIRKNSCC